VALVGYTHPGDFCFTQEPETGASCTVRQQHRRSLVVALSPADRSDRLARLTGGEHPHLAPALECADAVDCGQKSLEKR